jgi:hypothetical protein
VVVVVVVLFHSPPWNNPPWAHCKDPRSVFGLTAHERGQSSMTPTKHLWSLLLAIASPQPAVAKLFASGQPPARAAAPELGAIGAASVSLGNEAVQFPHRAFNVGCTGPSSWLPLKRRDPSCERESVGVAPKGGQARRHRNHPKVLTFRNESNVERSASGDREESGVVFEIRL